MRLDDHELVTVVRYFISDQNRNGVISVRSRRPFFCISTPFCLVIDATPKLFRCVFLISLFVRNNTDFVRTISYDALQLIVFHFELDKVVFKSISFRDKYQNK